MMCITKVWHYLLQPLVESEDLPQNYDAVAPTAATIQQDSVPGTSADDAPVPSGESISLSCIIWDCP